MSAQPHDLELKRTLGRAFVSHRHNKSKEAEFEALGLRERFYCSGLPTGHCRVDYCMNFTANSMNPFRALHAT